MHVICMLIGAVKGEWDFSIADHIHAVKGERRDGKKYWDAANDEKLHGTVSDQGAFEKRMFLHAKHMGAWMSIRDAMVTDTVLTAKEFRDFYVLITALTPLTPPKNVAAACKTFWCITC